MGGLPREVNRSPSFEDEQLINYEFVHPRVPPEGRLRCHSDQRAGIYDQSQRDLEDRPVGYDHTGRRRKLDERNRRQELRAMPIGIRQLSVMLSLAILCNGGVVTDLFAQDRLGTNDAAQARWSTANYDALAEQVFGPPTSSEPLPQRTVWVVTARVRPAYEDDPEVQFSITKQSTGDVTASMVTLDGPLRLQVEQILKERPGLAPQDVARSIAVQRINVTHTEHPQLARLAATFESMRPSVGIENVMVLDPRIYQLWVDAGSQQVYSNLLGPSNGAGRHPMIRWIEDALAELEKARIRARKQME